MENPQLKLAHDFVVSTGRHVFLTGKAGTGKTTFLHRLREHCPKRMVVVAPTGVAAINAGGVTIHSFFQVPFGPLIPALAAGPQAVDQASRIGRKFNRNKINVIKSLDLLVIDEISMVRADLLDGIDEVLRRYRDRNRPFGGVQLLMIGDLQQLAPVIKDDEWAILRPYYQTGFFFGSLALQQTQFVSIQLQHIYRQTDARFIELLNKVRENRMDAQVRAEFNQRYRPNFNPDDEEGYITLTTHNAQAERINEVKLDALTTRGKTMHGTVDGDFPEYMYPTALHLQLKIGAQVMFVKNDSDPEKRYFNGKIGTLTGFDDDAVQVKGRGDRHTIDVTPETWENIKYVVDEDSKELKEEVTGSFTQYPLKPAWAITIHKSQGLTFDKAIIDAQAAFAHGQVYVALSRCRTREGLVLSTPIGQRAVMINPEIWSFTRDIEKDQPGPEELAVARHDFQQQLLLDLFDFQSLSSLLNRLIRHMQEQSRAIAENPVTLLQDIRDELRQHIVEVASKFHKQIAALSGDPTSDIETNTALQERVKKGCAYFIEKITEILLAPVAIVEFDADNKAVRKILSESIEKLTTQAQRKVAGLQACSTGFSVRTYLKVRAETSIDARRPGKRRPSKADYPTVEVAHPRLYEQLSAWREKKARQDRVPPNTIITLQTLINLANDAPVTRTELMRVRGIGKKTMKKTGNKLLSILQAYRSSCRKDTSQSGSTAHKGRTTPTKQISFDLFGQGKTIAEVADERGLAVSTIETHLAHFVRIGALPLERFVPLKKAKPAIDFFLGADGLGLSAAKEHFGECYSYGELKMIVQHLAHKRCIAAPKAR